MKATVEIDEGKWVPCVFIGLLYGEEDLVAVVQIDGALVLRTFHPSRVRVAEVPER
jgi:hypothetical protein